MPDPAAEPPKPYKRIKDPPEQTKHQRVTNPAGGKGQFKPGHKGGPGRPKKQFTYQEILQQNCTKEDWTKIVQKAVRQALKGDAFARNFLAKYLIGDRIKIDVNAKVGVAHAHVDATAILRDPATASLALDLLERLNAGAPEPGGAGNLCIEGQVAAGEAPGAGESEARGPGDGEDPGADPHDPGPAR